MTVPSAIESVVTSVGFWYLSVGVATTVTVFAIAMSPAGHVLNIITVPLGYQFQSCPYCPDFGIKKITYTDCENCGSEITENFSYGRSPAGESQMHYFCNRECHDSWGDNQ